MENLDFYDASYLYVNQGGCGVFALILSSYLDKYQIPHKFVLHDSRYSQPDELIKANQFEGEFIEAGYVYGWTHISITFDELKSKKTLDSDNFRRRYGNLTILPKHQLQEWVHQSCWNRTYDRSDNWRLDQIIKREFAKMAQTNVKMTAIDDMLTEYKELIEF